MGMTSLYLIYPITKKPEFEISKQENALNFNDSIMKSVSLGQTRLLSSLLWTETLLNSDIEKYKGEKFKDWMFLRLKSILTLDPNFYEAYLYGGIYLSIIKDDDLGAEYVYDKALRIFPNDYYLNLNASFHYYYELGNKEKSIESLEKIIHDKRAPSYLSSLLIKMKSESGDLEGSLAFIYELYKSTPKDSPLHDSYEAKLYAVKAELDLNCLNTNKNSCNKKDFYGEPYIYSNGQYRAQREWTPLRIKRKSPPHND